MFRPSTIHFEIRKIQFIVMRFCFRLELLCRRYFFSIKVKNFNTVVQQKRNEYPSFSAWSCSNFPRLHLWSHDHSEAKIAGFAGYYSTNISQNLKTHKLTVNDKISNCHMQTNYRAIWDINALHIISLALFMRQLKITSTQTCSN